MGPGVLVVDFRCGNRASWPRAVLQAVATLPAVTVAVTPQDVPPEAASFDVQLLGDAELERAAGRAVQDQVVAGLDDLEGVDVIAGCSLGLLEVLDEAASGGNDRRVGLDPEALEGLHAEVLGELAR